MQDFKQICRINSIFTFNFKTLIPFEAQNRG